jgi:PglZ domain-containing protein
MAVVTDFLISLITKQVNERGLVVWYDPEQAYSEVAAEFSLPNTIVARYDGSFFKLRKEIDHLLNDGKAPRLVVYAPIEREKTHSALIEIDCAGVIMQPRQQPPTCNTRLSVVARNALKPILGEDQIVEIERQVEAGKLSLSDLDSLADKGKDISTGVLTLIFGSANPQEVALAFLHGDQYDKEVGKKEAEKEMRRLLQVAFDVELPAAETLANWRARLGRHVLLTDLFAALKKQAPPSLSSVSVANSAVGVGACVRLARTWRNSRDTRDGYLAAANNVEQELGLGRIELPVEPLKENETFLRVERALLEYVESELLKTATLDLLQLAEYRLSRFWADVIPAIQARWALISSAAEVLLEADLVGKAIKKAPDTVPELVKAYADDDEAWCLLDTHHRHMESRKYNFEFAATDDHEWLEKLITRAEQRYNEVGSELTRQFITRFHKAKHPIGGLLRQQEIFEKKVKPHLGEAKVAYLWVDALRFEMASELCRLLKDDFVLDIQSAIAAMPTITEIGMAALLPKAHESAMVVSVGGGKLALEIGGKVIRDRKDRVAFLNEHAGVPVFDAKLEDLLPKPTKKVKEGIENARLILITSQEIDELCEQDNIAQARLQIDGVLGHLRRGVRVLADHGVKTIVLTSDHGHLFADEIGEDMKIDAPGGKVEDLHRRVWVGVGGTSEPSYLRTSLASLGMDSEFDIATPWTFACFKSKGGGRAYFHGGLSLQELIVPVVVMKSMAKPSAPTTSIQWILTPGAAKLTTRFFSVQIAGSQSESSLFGFEPPKVRIELRANKKCVSIPVSASYGFEDATGEVKLKVAETDNKRIEPNTVTVMLSEEITQKTVGVYLLDATTGQELATPLTVDVAISM